MRTIITNAMVEIRLPDAIDAYEYEREMFTGSLRLSVMVNLDDVVLQLPAMNGKIGELQAAQTVKTITIKRFRLEHLRGTILPAQDADGTLVFFTIEKAAKDE